MFFIQQSNDHDCGFTALKILLANIHHDRNYLFLKDNIGDDHSFYSLIKEASNYQVELVALKALNKEEITDYKQLPFIARLEINEMYHAVYVYKVNKKYIHYYDPSYGNKKVLIDEFTSLWTGEMLSVKDFRVYKCPVSKPKLVTNKELCFTFLFELISAISMILAIYFINKESVIYLPLIFFTVLLVSELSLKKYSLFIMKRIDKRVDEMIKDIKDKAYEDFYLTYESYKKYLLINNISFVSSFFIFLLISLIFLVNDKMNFIYIVTNLLLAASYAFFIKPLLNKDEKEIIQNEAMIKKTNNKLEAFSYMDSARSLSYKYVDKIEAYKYVCLAIQVILTFIMMMYFQLVNVTYIICYSVLQFELYSHLCSLLTKNDDFSKQDHLLAKLVNIIINQ